MKSILFTPILRCLACGHEEKTKTRDFPTRGENPYNYTLMEKEWQSLSRHPIYNQEFYFHLCNTEKSSRLGLMTIIAWEAEEKEIVEEKEITGWPPLIQGVKILESKPINYIWSDTIQAFVDLRPLLSEITETVDDSGMLIITEQHLKAHNLEYSEKLLQAFRELAERVGWDFKYSEEGGYFFTKTSKGG